MKIRIQLLSLSLPISLNFPLCILPSLSLLFQSAPSLSLSLPLPLSLFLPLSVSLSMYSIYVMIVLVIFQPISLPHPFLALSHSPSLWIDITPSPLFTLSPSLALTHMHIIGLSSFSNFFVSFKIEPDTINMNKQVQIKKTPL